MTEFLYANTATCGSCKKYTPHVYDEENYICCSICGEIGGLGIKSKFILDELDNPREPLKRKKIEIKGN